MKLGTMTRSGPLLTITSTGAPYGDGLADAGVGADDLAGATVSENWSGPCVTVKPAASSVGLGLVEGALRDVRDLHRRVALAHGQGDGRIGQHFRALRRVDRDARAVRHRVGEFRVRFAEHEALPRRSVVLGVGLRLVHDLGDRDRRGPERDDDVHRRCRR